MLYQEFGDVVLVCRRMNDPLIDAPLYAVLPADRGSTSIETYVLRCHSKACSHN